MSRWLTWSLQFGVITLASSTTRSVRSGRPSGSGFRAGRRRPSNGASPARTFIRHRSPVCRLPLEAVLSTRRTGSSPQWLCSGGTQGHPRDRRPGAPPTARIVRLGAPLLALVLALLGVHPFTIISTSLTPIGGASSAFVGITVARTRHPRLSPAVWAIALTGVIAQPLLTYGVGQWITTGTIAARATLITAFPISPVPMMLASRHVTTNGQQLIASTVALSLVLSIVTLPLIIHLTSRPLRPTRTDPQPSRIVSAGRDGRGR